MSEEQTALKKKDFLWENLRQLPYFRAFLRAVESRFYEGIPLLEPLLDVGCGDGAFAETTFDKKITVGFDPAYKSVREAAKREAYLYLLCAQGAALPFPDAFFATVISNSVLEHIPELDEVLSEISRVLRLGGTFLFSVPNDQLLKNLSISKALDKLKLHQLASCYRKFFNKISRHYHADSIEVWKERLAKHGFRIVQGWNYFSPQNLATLEWGHYFGLPSLINKKIFGRWILFPFHGNPFIPEKRLRKQYEQNPISAAGSYTFYITRKE